MTICEYSQFRPLHRLLPIHAEIKFHTPHPVRHLRIRVDPSPSEIDNKPFGIVTALEAIR